MIKVFLSDHHAILDRNSGTLTLADGTSCQMGEGTCRDSDGTQHFWDLLPADLCEFKYQIIYEGIGKKFYDNTETQHPVVYSVEDNEITFALTAISDTNVCAYKMIVTEHPKLFIIESVNGTFTNQRDLATENIDMLAYVNTKFVYVEKYLRKKLTTLYTDIIKHKCELERQVLMN